MKDGVPKWTNGPWTISWKDLETVEIRGPHNQKCHICGGDFEGVLSALCAVMRTNCMEKEQEDDRDEG